jgi:predicted HAD superfamily Cof-like phosphohydrolase
VLDLRRTLLREEFEETIAALDVVRAHVAAGDDVTLDDLAAVGHELADLLYVTYGTFLALGLPADAVFTEVHRANLAKAAGPRRADGKQLRPEGWQPADVAAVIAG